MTSLLSAALLFASCGERASSERPVEAEDAVAAIRAKMQKMPPEALTEFINQNALAALNTIVQATPLAGVVESVFGGASPRVRIELTDNVPQSAARYGIKDFQGDAFTITAEHQQAGKPTTFEHIVYLQDSCFVSKGKLIVVLSHELLHMKRREEGVPMTSLRDEEVAVFSSGINLAEDLVRDAKVDSRTAQEITAALAEDRATLARWVRTRR